MDIVRGFTRGPCYATCVNRNVGVDGTRNVYPAFSISTGRLRIIPAR